jgi:flavorubredoxin
MPSRKALKYAFKEILKVPFTTIAPQHGSIITDRNIMRYVFELLISEKQIGIDRIIENENSLNFSNLRERLERNEN